MTKEYLAEADLLDCKDIKIGVNRAASGFEALTCQRTKTPCAVCGKIFKSDEEEIIEITSLKIHDQRRVASYSGHVCVHCLRTKRRYDKDRIKEKELSTKGNVFWVMQEAGKGPERTEVSAVVKNIEKHVCTLEREIDKYIAKMSKTNELLSHLQEVRQSYYGRFRQTYPERRKTANQVISKRELRALVFARDDFKCVSCGASSHLCVDHVVPVVKGGSNDEGNLQTLCRSCNSKKGGR